MKVLFTCIGRRVELVQAFRAAAEKLHIDLTIYATDVTQTAPALSFCDKKLIAPSIKDREYIPYLLELCKKEKINGLIPTIDTDLLALSENRQEFEKIGTTVFVAAPEKVRLCRDKRLTSDYFERLGLNAPKAFDDAQAYTMGYPAFIKPKDGSSSINAYMVKNETELATYAKKIGDYVVQPFISGTEYTVDIFCDKVGAPVFITPRIRLAVRAGEVLKTEIRQNREIVEEMFKLIEDFRPCGGITVQLIRNEEQKRNWYIEINPRFGGGAPLSIKAGADSAEALLKVLLGEKLDYRENAAEDGAVFSRFDQSVRVK